VLVILGTALKLVGETFVLLLQSRLDFLEFVNLSAELQNHVTL
jgi:hypothetical protein